MLDQLSNGNKIRATNTSRAYNFQFSSSRIKESKIKQVIFIVIIIYATHGIQNSILTCN